MRIALGRSTAAAIALVAMMSTPITALASVPSSIGSYVSYGYGTGVHTIAGTSAFPNFENGAVNNHYPLAQVRAGRIAVFGSARDVLGQRAWGHDGGLAVQPELQRGQSASPAERLRQSE